MNNLLSCATGTAGKVHKLCIAAGDKNARPADAVRTGKPLFCIFPNET